MSLWVEFITASGYLSSRKIRARFQALMIAAIEKSRFKGMVEVLPHVCTYCGLLLLVFFRQLMWCYRYRINFMSGSFLPSGVVECGLGQRRIGRALSVPSGRHRPLFNR